MSSTHEDAAGLFALETDKISKHFGAVRAVDQLSLSIPRKGVTSIVGPNGSGKSTLVNLLSGTLPLDGGLVIIDGVGLKIVKAYETPGHGLTRTFQEVRLFDQISVWDNIMVVLTERRLLPALLQRTRSSHREKAQRVLETVGMWEKRDSLAMNLSYGQRKLLEIGRALALDVSTYLLDEPYAGSSPRCGEGEGHHAGDAGRRAHHHFHLPQHGHCPGVVGPHNRAGGRLPSRPGGRGGGT